MAGFELGQTAASRPRVAAITVTHRSNEVLPHLLRSLESAVSEPIAVVVVDNDPDAATNASAIASSASAQYVPRADNPGYGGAINAGAAELPDSVEWILVCNPDLELAEGSVDALLATARSDASIGAVGPAVFNLDGSIYPSARAIPSLRTGVGHALFVGVWPSNPWTASYLRDSVHELVQRDAGWLSGACVLVRRSAFDAIGGFDERYFMYFEDVDLGFRLGKRGYRNVYLPTAHVTHIGGHSTSGESTRMVRAHHDSARQFLSRKYRGWYWWPVRASLGLGLRARSAVFERRARQG